MFSPKSKFNYLLLNSLAATPIFGVVTGLPNTLTLSFSVTWCFLYLFRLVVIGRLVKTNLVQKKVRPIGPVLKFEQNIG
jgi:hypothetical protein